MDVLSRGKINLVEAAPFVLLCLVGLYVARRFFWSVQEEKARRFTPPEPPTQQDDEQKHFMSIKEILLR
jgi:hypothetical protein